MVEYQKAADYYKGEEQRSSAGKGLLKVAALAAELEQYQRAMHTFEEVAIYESENNMLKYSAKTHFFQVNIFGIFVEFYGIFRHFSAHSALTCWTHKRR